ncbi:MAG: M20 family metallopeptidase [Gemmataceae bacterium]
MPETTQLLADLVAIPSVNPMGREVSGPEYLEVHVGDYIESFLRPLGVSIERQTIAPGRDNIVARYQGGSARSILFEAHMDTVPAENMIVPPFSATFEGGRLHGRGACDVKGGLAAMLTAFARLAREKPPHSASVLMACTVDEEHTFLGVQRLMQGLVADEAIAAEPTQLRIVHAHKGVVRWHLTTPGRSCHSSTPDQGVNAIYRMGKLLAALESYGGQLNATRRDPILGPATLSVGRIEGGSSVNTVPDRCVIEIDRRLIPGEEPDAVRTELGEFLRNDGRIDFPFELSPAWIKCPALSSDNSTELVQRLGASIAAVLGSHQVEVVPYGTDASTIARAGIPTVVFGPGDIAQAHTSDEWIDLEQLEQASEILYRFAAS